MKLPITILFCLLPFLILAQEESPKTLKKQGEEYFLYKKYPEALVKLQQYYGMEGADEATVLKIGIAAYYSNRLNLANKNLDYLLNNKKSPTAETYLYKAKTLHLQHQFKQAAEFYKKFLTVVKDKHPLRTMVKEDIRRCGIGIRLNILDKTIIVENLGKKVNSIGDEFAPILSPNYQDRLYFSSIRVGNQGGLRDDNGFLDQLKGQYKADMYKTRVINGEWAATETNEPFLNSPQHDVIMDFNSDGSVMYFSKSTDMYSGEVFIDTFANRNNRGLFPPAFESPMQMENGDQAPFFFQDTIMFFSSRRAGGYGGLDLYYTIYQDGTWTTAQNLGANINSPYDESYPFLATNGRTLYFSSNNSYKSVGAYDIFKSTFNPNKKEWSSSENLGLPTNSAGNDTHFRISKDGFKAYFASHRSSSLGKSDLYIVYFQTPLPEQISTTELLSFQEILAQQNLANKPDLATTTPSSSTNTTKPSIKVYEFEPLFYEDDNDILSPKNIKKINTIIHLLKKYPQLNLVLTCHSNKTASPKFDLYFSIKRMDKIVDYMEKNGIAPGQIVIKGVGASYPIALGEWNNNPNPIGQALNKRIDIQFLNIGDLPIQINTIPPKVDKMIEVPDYKYFNTASKGLSYKVQISAIKQMYHGNLIMDYPNPMIEKTANTELYRYTVGLYKTYSSAHQLQKDLVANGVTDAFVVPYINGVRPKKDEISYFSDVYPDLKHYLSTKSKD